MIKKIVLILFISVLCYSQAIYSPKIRTPFFTTDTVLSASTMTSAEMDISTMLGAIVFAVRHDSINSAGTDTIGAVGDTLNIYVQIEVHDLGFQTFYDSLGADSMHLATIDSANVISTDPVYINLSDQDWWGWAERIRFIFDYEESADSLFLYNCILKGQ